MERRTVFKQLKVIEVASVLAGPSTGLFFAELGAKVIKIENALTKGDVTRSWKLKSEDPNKSTSAYFHSVNFFKQHLFLDFNSIQDRKKVTQLLKNADIFIANFKKGEAEKFCLDYKSLKELKPTIIYASITGFGEDSDRLAYDLILQAETGFMSMNGNARSGPLKMPVALIDLIAAHMLKQAILIALLKRQNSGKGSFVSVSLYDAALASLANQATNYLIGGIIPQRLGSLHPNIAPYGELFTTKDKVTLTFAIGSDRQFIELCRLLGCENLAFNPKFSSNQKRVKHRSELSALIARKVKQLFFIELSKACLKKKIPFAQLKNLQEVFQDKRSKRLIYQIKEGSETFQVLSSFPVKID